MTSPLEKLLAISSEPIVAQDPDSKQMATFLRPWKKLGRELCELLGTRNGFWAYESSLLLRPYQSGELPLGLIEWNDKQLWKSGYVDDLNAVLFFAEDVFGCQYCIAEDKVSLFDPETGQLEEIANSLEECARIVMEDYEYRTGYPLAHAWQTHNHPLPPGTRLLPRVPFVLGGKYELSNLCVGSDVDGMVFRASIANQIRDVPDGGQVVLEVVNNAKQ